MVLRRSSSVRNFASRVLVQRTPRSSSASWNAIEPCAEDDYDVLADGAVVGRIMGAAASPVGLAVDVDADFRLSRTSLADARLGERCTLFNR